MLSNIIKKFLAITLSCTIIFQLGLTSAYGANEQDNGNSSSQITTHQNSATKEELISRINNLRTNGLYLEEENNVYLNSRNITVDKEGAIPDTVQYEIDSTFQLNLSVNGKIQTEGVEWYCYTAYPENLYRPSELQATFDKLAADSQYKEDENIAAFVSDTGLVTGKVSKGSVIVFALYENRLYPCIVSVRDGAETKKNVAMKKIQDIIKEEGISQLASRADQVLAVHDYMAKNIVYDMKYLHADFEYDAVINNRAVCNGYAKAFKMFMNCLSIPCEYRSGNQDGSAHAWDIVKMDDNKWYYIDVTQDRKLDQSGNYAGISYKKFLVDRATFISWKYALREEMAEGENGTDYLCYPYKKAGLFAETEDEISKIVNFQLNASNSSSAKIEVAVPIALKDNVKKAISEWKSDLEVFDSYIDMGKHYLMDCQVNGIVKPAGNTQISFNEVTDVTSDGLTTSELQLSFSGPIYGLSKEDVKITGADIDSLSYNNNNTYTLKISNVSPWADKKLEVCVAKEGFSISPSSKYVYANIKKLETPQITAEAIDDKSVMLTGFSSTMEYSTGSDKWIKFPSQSGSLKLDVPYPYTIDVINRSASSGTVDSAIQRITLNMQTEPYNVKCDSTATGSTGKIYGVSTSMEYSGDSGQTWTSCQSNIITGLSAGTYYVRMKANGLSLASPFNTLTIGAGEGGSGGGDVGGGAGGGAVGGGAGGGAVGGLMPSPEETENSVAPDITIESGKASALLDEKTCDKLIENAHDNNNRMVEIDATTGKNISLTEIKLPAKMMNDLVNKTSFELLLKTDACQIHLDRKLMEELLSKSSSGYITFSLEKKAVTDKRTDFQLVIQTDKGKVLSSNTGKATITINRNNLSQLPEKLGCIYKNENDLLSQLKVTNNEDGSIIFETNDFSEFSIMEQSEADSIIKKQTNDIIKQGVKSIRISLDSKAYKKSIKVTWTKSKGYKIDYYQVFRSVKKSSGYGTKPFFTTSKTYYINSKNLKKGVSYYYKIRGVRKIDGKNIYTNYFYTKKIKFK